MKAPPLILGSGPAGLTAAIYCARAGHSPIVLDGPLPGGALSQTTVVENYPGFAEPVPALDLLDAMRAQALRLGAVFREGTALSLERVEADGGSFWRVRLAPEAGTETASFLDTPAVVVATGTAARTLGLPHEAALMGRGVSTCATCDGAFFRKKPVAVVGSGNIAVKEAIYLAGLCSKVTLVFSTPRPEAHPILAERFLALPNTEFLPETEVLDFLPAESAAPGMPARLQALLLRSVRDASAPADAATSVFPVAGVFLATPRAPNTGFLKGLLRMNPDGTLPCAPDGRTELPGLYAAGDVAEPVGRRQAVLAAGAGCAAALSLVADIKN